MRQLFLISFMFCTLGFGAQINHNIRANDTNLSLLSQRVCHGLEQTTNRLLCIPDRKIIAGKGGFDTDILFKVNQQALETFAQLINQDYDQKLITRLFESNDFETASGLASLKVSWKNISLAYIPVHFMGAYKLINPTLPELYVGVISQSLLDFSYRSILFLSRDYGELLMVTSLQSFSREYISASSDLITNSISKFKERVRREEYNGIQGDLGISWLSKIKWLPTTTLQLRQIGKSTSCRTCEHRQIEYDQSLEPVQSLHFSWSMNHNLGRSFFGSRLPFRDNLQTYDALDSSFTLGYKLNHLVMMSSFSPLMWSFGFIFEPGSYQLGIQYSDEKQDNQLELARQRQTYVYTTYKI